MLLQDYLLALIVCSKFDMPQQKDQVSLSLLSNVIKAGWPEEKRSVQPAVRAYWDARDEFVVDGSLIFKGHRLVIPVCLRAELMARTHASHIGIEGSSLCTGMSLLATRHKI